MQKELNTPKLRFPKFTKEWEKKKLGEVCEIKTGSKDTQNKVENGLYPFFVRSNTVERINSFSYDGEAILTSGDGVGVGKNFHYINGKFDFHQRVYSLRNFKEGYDGKYIYNIFSELFYERVIKLSAKNSVDSIRMSMISDMVISFPSLYEQQMIASFFSAIDKKVHQLKHKKSYLEQYKKGVMQKLFSQELRFRADNGEEFPKWEEKKFGDVFSFRITNSYSRENLNYDTGEIKNIHYGDIHTKLTSHFDITREKIPFVNPEMDLKRILEGNYCKEGDLVIADASEDYADVGKAIEVVNLNGEKVLAGLHTILARPDLFKMSLGFSGHLLKSENIRLQIKTIAQGSKVLSISATRLSNIYIDVPCELEQFKISTFLSAIDEKINRTDNQIQQSQVYKKGLLQQMFI